MSYLNDPREMAIRPESGVTLEEDNRYEEMWHWGARVLDLCDLPVEEYMKPMTVNVNGGGGGGGGSDTGSTNPSYTLKFVLDGTTKKTYSLEEGAPIPEVSGEKEGYDFSGWKDASGNTPTTMPASNLTLYGVNTIKKFTVKFSVDGEELANYEQEIEWGKKITNFPASAKTGYTFSGWEPAIPASVKQDYTFVGTFTKNSYTLTLKISANTTTQDYEFEDDIVYPERDIKEGYIICGWTPYYSQMPASSVTVTAVLSAIPYSVQFLVDEGEGMDHEIVAEYTLNYGQTIPSVAVPAKSGYSFTQWSADTQIVGNKMPASDVKFYTKKTTNSYKLNYYVDGVKDGNEVTLLYGSVVTPREKYEKEGYTVTDWVFTPALDEVPQELGGGVAMPYHNVSATCQTSINSYNVVVKYGNNVLYQGQLEYGASVASLIPEGYTYSGNVTTVPANDIELNVSINSYDVVINIPGKPSFTLTLEYGSDIKSAVEDYIENNYSADLVGHHLDSNIPNGATVPASNVSYTVEILPNQHQVTFSQDGHPTVVIDLNYGDNILEALEGQADVDEFHYLDGWTMNGQPIGANDTMPDEDITVAPVIKVKEAEVTPVVSGDTATGSTTYDYGTPISEVIEDIIASATPETQADLEDPGYEVEWTVNGSAYTPDMVVREDEVTVEVTITPKPFKLSFMRRATDSIPAGLVESGETLYKEEIVYPETPANLEVSGRTYEFKWDDGSVEEGTPMPSSAVTVYGAYVEKVGATNIFYGGIMDSDLGANPNFAAFAQSMSSATLTAMPEYIVFRLPSLEDEYNDFEGEDEEWIPDHMYTFFVLVPEGKSVTEFRVGATNQPNIAGSIYEKSYGNVTVNGLSYDVYGYQRDNYYVMDSPEVAKVYITVQ